MYLHLRILSTELLHVEFGRQVPAEADELAEVDNNGGRFERAEIEEHPDEAARFGATARRFGF